MNERTKGQKIGTPGKSDRQDGDARVSFIKIMKSNSLREILTIQDMATNGSWNYPICLISLSIIILKTCSWFLYPSSWLLACVASRLVSLKSAVQYFLILQKDGWECARVYFTRNIRESSQQAHHSSYTYATRTGLHGSISTWSLRLWRWWENPTAWFER